MIITNLIDELRYKTVDAMVRAFADCALTDGSDAPVTTIRDWWQTVQQAIAHDSGARTKLAQLALEQRMEPPHGRVGESQPSGRKQTARARRCGLGRLVARITFGRF